jgi:ABC-type spermidine/putrescine transport system permease subunit I
LVFSFSAYTPFQIALPEFTFDNYLRVLDGFYIRIFLRTMKLGLYTTVATAVLSYPVAYYLARSSQRALTVGLFLLITPLMVSTVIRVFGWIVILGRKGLVNETLVSLGLEPVGLLGTEGAVVIGLVQLFMPFMVLPLIASIDRISTNIEESALNLGANWYQMFARVILPLSVPGLISGCLLTYTLSISAFVTPALLGGARVRMAGEQIYEDVLASFNWPGGSALALVLVAITLAILFVALRATARRGRLEAGR